MEATSKIPSGWSLRENTESVLEAAIQTGDEPGKSLGSPWRYILMVGNSERVTAR